MAGKKARNAKKRHQRLAASALRRVRSRERNATNPSLQIPLQDRCVTLSNEPSIIKQRNVVDENPHSQQVNKPVFTCPFECIPPVVAKDKNGCVLVPGDHIRTPMLGGLYYHEGLFLGGVSVIHYSGMTKSDSNGSVDLVPIDRFADADSIEVVPHPQPRFNRDESISRALGRLMESRYNLVLNNCEHFVNWCIEGDHRSEQVNNAMTGAVNWLAMGLYGARLR